MIFTKARCYGWCKKTSTLSEYLNSLYCNCVYDWDKLGLANEMPSEIPEHCKIPELEIENKYLEGKDKL